MHPLLTKDATGGVVFVYSGHVIIASVKSRRVYFECITGIESSYKLSLAEAKQWLTDEGVEFKSITKNKIACKPHVCGFRGNYSLVYNPISYNMLPEESKKRLLFHSITKHYSQLWRKEMKQNAEAQTSLLHSNDTKNCLPCSGFRVYSIKKSISSINTSV
jgi:hypothetical protein